jgi:hypothetical protein
METWKIHPNGILEVALRIIQRAHLRREYAVPVDDEE